MSDIDIIIRIVLALFIGAIIGFERERHGRAAGLRTHMLVCTGSALIAMTSIYLAENYGSISQNCDPARVAAGIITGIGFLGAGTIIRSKTSVLGLTTAASLWAVSGLGLAVGIGFYKAAIFAAIAIFLTLFVIGRVMWKYLGKGDAQLDIDG
ncbi:MAG: MgtC/SapB family protein [Candidatus Omnitrophica bacterium]|nr:MgtC/SapB family protein [Candidatus Omnitrophota bacterium]